MGNTDRHKDRQTREKGERGNTDRHKDRQTREKGERWNTDRHKDRQTREKGERGNTVKQTKEREGGLIDTAHWLLIKKPRRLHWQSRTKF